MANGGPDALLGGYDACFIFRPLGSTFPTCRRTSACVERPFRSPHGTAGRGLPPPYASSVPRGQPRLPSLSYLPPIIDQGCPDQLSPAPGTKPKNKYCAGTPRGVYSLRVLGVNKEIITSPDIPENVARGFTLSCHSWRGTEPVTTRITRITSPEARELEKKKAELASLEARLAERELDLATLQAELHSFEGTYLRIVGSRLAELDEIQARIAEAEARNKPKDRQAQERASQARAQAQESAQAVEAERGIGKREPFTPSDDLKRLYREVAKCIHPDLATDESERKRRHELMTEANRAYEEGDVARLEAILRDWESSPESVKGEGPGAELVRVIRKIAQVEDRLNAIDAEIARLKKSDLYDLKNQVDQAREKGRDFLAEMAARVDQQVVEARRRLRSITGYGATL